MRPLALRRTARHAALLTLLAIVALPALSQWKWRDAQGRIQYSDRPPPPSVAPKNILQHPPGMDQAPVVVVVGPIGAAASAAAPAASASVPKGKLTEAGVDAQRRDAAAAEEAQRAAEQARVARQQADNCQRARDYARSLESGARIARVDANGERIFLDDAQRAQEMGRAREVMSSDCK